MATLDDNYIDPADVPILPTALYYGGIAGLITVLIGLASSLLGLSDAADSTTPMSIAIAILNWGVIVGAIVMAIKSQRDNELGGYISMGRSISTGMLTVAILALISIVWTYVFFTFVDPGMIEEIRSLQLEELEKQGLSDEQIEESLPMLEKFTTPAIMGLMGAIMTLVVGLIVSAVAGAILKKENPMA